MAGTLSPTGPLSESAETLPMTGRPLAEGALAVVADTDAVLAATPTYASLTVMERARAAALPREDVRRDFLAAHLLVRRCVARYLGDAAWVVLEQRCSGCGSREHGKPSVRGLPRLCVSLSHTAGVVAAAASWSPVGVDVETAPRRSPRAGAMAALHRRALTSAERAAIDADTDPQTAFLRQWTRKESLVKVDRASLDRLTDTDLSALPVDSHPAPRTVRHQGWNLLDWTDLRRSAVISVASPGAIFLDPFPYSSGRQ